jgi:hypothetical protein
MLKKVPEAITRFAVFIADSRGELTGKGHGQRFPVQYNLLLQGNGMYSSRSREETYFTLLINIYSLNLLQAVI